MRILEVCPYSAGICGVWSRASEEAKLLAEKGHELRIFSSNHVKGSNEIAKEYDNIGKIKIQRFKTMKLGGESFMYFNFKKEALEFKPDIIIAHNYRHLHTIMSLIVARKLKKLGHKCKVILVTHAPFVEGNITRSFFQSMVVGVYDNTVGSLTLPRFDSILPISHWEVPFLLKIGAKKNKIRYVPNGIPDLFFTQKKILDGNNILFLGRISPKKKLDTLIRAVSILNEKKKVYLDIIGPEEKAYSNQMKSLSRSLGMDKRIKFHPPIKGLIEKIKAIDKARLFVLPSRVEGMPQALIEAMSREKLVIGSNSIAIRDIIKNSQNGYLFEFDNPSDLAKVIDMSLSKDNSKIKKAAKKSVESFSWNNVAERLQKVLNEVYSTK